MDFAFLYTKQIKPRSFGSWCVKGTEESTLEVDFSVPLTHHDLKDLGLICLVKKRKIHFRILSDLTIQLWIFLKKRTLSFSPVMFVVAVFPVILFLISCSCYFCFVLFP